MNSLNPEAHALKSTLLRHFGDLENAALSARRARPGPR